MRRLSKCTNSISSLHSTDDSAVIDRRSLGQLVFADEAKRTMLNNIVWPAVGAMVLEVCSGALSRADAAPPWAESISLRGAGAGARESGREKCHRNRASRVGRVGREKLWM